MNVARTRKRKLSSLNLLVPLTTSMIQKKKKKRIAPIIFQLHSAIVQTSSQTTKQTKVRIQSKQSSKKNSNQSTKKQQTKKKKKKTNRMTVESQLQQLPISSMKVENVLRQGRVIISSNQKKLQQRYY